jgi:hypothetical protein
MLKVGRREFLVGASAVAMLSTIRPAFSQIPAGPFTLIPLDYAYSALEPHIDRLVSSASAYVRRHPNSGR